MMKIGYLTDDPGPAFAKAMRGAKTKAALLAALSDYKRVASDAIEIVSDMTPAAFRDFRVGLAKESRGRYAGDAWAAKYGVVVMPDVMFTVSMVAQRFGAPWGCAFIRMSDEGHIAESGGRARLTEKWTQATASASEPEAKPKPSKTPNARGSAPAPHTPEGGDGRA